MKARYVMLVLLAVGVGRAAMASESVTDAIISAIANEQRTVADRKRDETSKPAQVLGFFGVKPGMHVLDLLSGGGYYSEILSHVVGERGEVVAHTNDIYERYHGVEIARRYGGRRLANVKRLISNPPDLNLPTEAFDLVLMVLIYHDVYYVSEANPKHPRIDRDRFFAEIYRSLKPRGVLAVVDHAAKSGTNERAAQDLHRIDEEFARRDIEAAGFVFERESRVLRNPTDDKTVIVFDERVRRKTDRFVHRFVKAARRDGS